MFTLEDNVINQETGQLGKVIGYGHQIVNNVYTVTLKVLVSDNGNSRKRVYVVEDKISAWSPWSMA
ncbi:hypothetical protein NIES22_42630 [Calothrix brevissima NIES-22]|nr:hypothetical protein NIES22_42630 [Calothrix brevissima NIES-22]